MYIKNLFLILLLVCLSPESFAKQITTEMYPDGDTTKSNPVTVTYNAEYYQNGRWFSQIKKGLYQASPEEQFVIRVIETNRNGTKEQLLSLFDAGSLSYAKELINDPEVFEKNKNFFKTLEDSAFQAKVFYGKYTIYFIQHNYFGSKYFINHMPVISENGRYFLAPKDLEDDPVYLYFLNKFDEELESNNLQNRPTRR